MDGDGGVDLVSGVVGIADSGHDDQFFVDLSYVSNYGSWVEITLGRGEDSVQFGSGITIARINYRGAEGGVLADLQAGTATDINAGDSFIGDDTFSGVTAFRGSAYHDQVTAASAGSSIRGSGGSDLLIGRAGNDTLDGDDYEGNPNETFADTMRGGGGNDIYYVNDLGDLVDESVAGSNGYDTVNAVISVDLASTSRFAGDIEAVTLLGTDNLNASGNAA